MLRTAVVYTDEGKPLLVVTRKNPERMFYADIRGLRDRSPQQDALSQAQEDYLRQLMRMMAEKGRKEGAPLMEAGLIRADDEKFYLFLRYSHGILDGIGVKRISEELLSDEKLTGDAELIQAYFRNITQRDGSSEMGYWKEVMRTVGDLTRLTPPAGSGQGMIYRNRWLGKVRGDMLKMYCSRQGVTLSAYLHNTLGQALCAVLDTENICVLTIESGRSSAVTTDDQLTGSFMNRFPFVYTRGDSLSDSLQKICRGMEYDWVLHMEGEAFKKCSGHEIIVDMTNFIKEDGPWVREGAVNARLTTILQTKEIAKHQIDGLMIFINPSGQFTVNYAYDSDKIDRDVVERIFDRWKAVILEDLEG